MDQVSSTFQSVLSAPESYLEPTERMREICLCSVRQVYALCKESCRASGVPSGPLAELYTDGFDIEQVWEQVQLLNAPVLSHVSKEVEKIDERTDLTLLFPSVANIVQKESEDESQPEEDNEQDDAINERKNETADLNIEQHRNKGQISSSSSAVKPNFFDLNAMEKYLKEAESTPLQDGEELEDASEDEDFDEENQMDACYEDFFDPSAEGSVKKKTGNRAEEDESEDQVGDDVEHDEIIRDDEELEGEDSEGDGVERDSEVPAPILGTDETGNESFAKDKHSSFEKSQKKLQKQIASIESVNLSNKPWQMAGEVTDHSRPVNSLLEEDLEFDQMTRPQPVITEEKTQSLEDIIRQRVVDEAWDDVERKVKPKEKPYNYSLQQPLDQEKSKLSLAQVYEQEYIQKTQESKEEKEDERHKEIKELMKSLFLKLDALSNFYLTPKPIKPEVKIVANVPAVTLEEVAPVSMSDAKLLAPEEIMPKSRHVEVGDTEKTAVDRRRERRLKKKQKKLKKARNTHKQNSTVNHVQKAAQSSSGLNPVVNDIPSTSYKL